ncbi:MAG: LptA/OstA family protein [Syntrophobacterales bacterium]|jgi:lipopolysaccharide export system protein LptA
MRQPLYLVLGLLLALPVMGTPAWGQGAAPKVPRSQPTPPRKTPAVQKPEIPLYISASQLEADQDKRLIVFKGQVKVVYGEATLYADRLLVYYQPGEKGRPSSAAASKPQEISPLGDLGGEKIDRIEAQGKVHFVQGDRVATGEKAIYYRDQDKIVLLGNPQVWRGENHLRGSKITIYLASRKVVVQGTSQRRVEAHLYQGTEGGQSLKDLFPGGPEAAPRSGRSR